MKANAPDMIYLLPDDRNPNGLSICWYDAPYRTGAIEYIRADAFMERAKKWFEKRNEWIGLDGFIYRDMESFEDFKNYMKGE